jgi:hypothetical protein
VRKRDRLFFRSFTDRTQESANALPAGDRAGSWWGASVRYGVTRGVEQPEDMVEDAAVATVAWPVASRPECVVARPRAFGSRVVLGSWDGLQDVHNDDLCPGLTVRVTSAMLYAPERLSLPTCCAGARQGWLSPYNRKLR